MTNIKIDAARLQAMVKHYCDKQSPTQSLYRQIQWTFWLSLRRRAQDELAALDTEQTESRSRARLLREIIREISEIVQARTANDRLDGEALDRIKTNKAIRCSDEIWHLTASIGYSVYREMRADFCLLEAAVLASHPAAKPYRKFYHEFKEALKTISGLLCGD